MKITVKVTVRVTEEIVKTFVNRSSSFDKQTGWLYIYDPDGIGISSVFKNFLYFTIV